MKINNERSPKHGASVEKWAQNMTIEGVAYCASCGTLGHENDRFCAACGTVMEKGCSHCGAPIRHALANYCTQCGETVEHE